MQAAQEAFDNELRAQIEPADLTDNFGTEVFFSGRQSTLSFRAVRSKLL
jgi:hypothetical protein